MNNETLSPTNGIKPPPIPVNYRSTSGDSTTVSSPTQPLYDNFTTTTTTTSPPPLPARFISVDLDQQTNINDKLSNNTTKPPVLPKRSSVTSPLSITAPLHNNNSMSPIHESITPVTACISPTNSTPPQYSSSAMSQHLDHLMKQAEAGTNTVKRLSNMLSKLYTIQCEYATSINKLLTNESNKQHKHMSHNVADGMQSIQLAYKKLCESLHEHSKSTIESAQLLNIDVIEPLQSLYEQCDSKRKVLVQTEKQSMSEVQKARADVSARYQQCMKLLQQLQQAKQNDNIQQNNNQNSTSSNQHNARTDSLISSTKSLFNNLKLKVIKTPAQLQSDAVEKSKLYTTSIAFANSRSKQYETSELPYYWTQLQQLDTERIDQTKTHLTRLITR